jgi:hypothetical protein
MVAGAVVLSFLSGFVICLSLGHEDMNVLTLVPVGRLRLGSGRPLAGAMVAGTQNKFTSIISYLLDVPSQTKLLDLLSLFRVRCITCEIL